MQRTLESLAGCGAVLRICGTCNAHGPTSFDMMLHALSLGHAIDVHRTQSESTDMLRLYTSGLSGKQTCKGGQSQGGGAGAL